MCRKLRKSKVEVIFGGFVEDFLCQGGGSFGCGGAGSPEDDVELGWVRWGKEVGGFGEALVEIKSGAVTGFETLGEGATGGVGEELLSRPEGHGGGAGAGAF